MTSIIGEVYPTVLYSTCPLPKIIGYISQYRNFNGTLLQRLYKIVNNDEKQVCKINVVQFLLKREGLIHIESYTNEIELILLLLVTRLKIRYSFGRNPYKNMPLGSICRESYLNMIIHVIAPYPEA